MFPAALSQAHIFCSPTAVFVHTFVHRQLDMWRGMIARLDGMRRQAGFYVYRISIRFGVRAISSSRLASPNSTRSRIPAGRMCVMPARCSSTSSSRFRRRCPGSRATKRRLSLSASRPALNSAMSRRCSERSTLWPICQFMPSPPLVIVAPNEVATPPNAVVLSYAAHYPIMRRAALHDPRGTLHCHRAHARRSDGLHTVLAGYQPFVAAAIQ